MRRISYAHIVLALVLLPLSPVLVACGGGGGGDDGSVIGTWVSYGLIDDGDAGLEGGSNGGGGVTLTINGDGTGTLLHPMYPGGLGYFDWTRAGNVLSITSAEGTTNLTIDLAGDSLRTVASAGGHVTESLWQLHRGPEVLVGTWEIVSMVDDLSGETDLATPGQFSFRFGSAGYFLVNVGGILDLAGDYTTDGTSVTMGIPGGEYETHVYTVVGSTLYLFRFVADDPVDRLVVSKFVRR